MYEAARWGSAPSQAGTGASITGQAQERGAPAPAPETTGQTSRVSRLFGRIVPTYDLMNRLMSLGQDQAWRRRAAALAAPEPLALGLDVATGTADLALALASRVRQVVGVDVCGPMLPVARAKVARVGRSHQLRFLLSDVYQLPFPDASFQCVTVGFGVRNMADPV
ncbi:MAG: class I SAM-dependent methyltransferase, partial [Chloroflexi bacterium]|nr:class I SAM-dependent methyltransferase [Chloroflexota bacterium]